MEESYNDSEESVSLGPAALITHDDSQQEPGYSVGEEPTDSSFALQFRSNQVHAMGQLSISSIPPVDSSNPGCLITSVLSPDGDFRPDILMSTINSKPASTSQEEELSISMGPLPAFSTLDDGEPVEVQETSLVRQIQKLDVRQRMSQVAAQLDCKSVQTEEFQCLKCEELHLCYNQKLLEVANEFQRQYASQFQMIDQHAATSEEAQRQIRDLMDQLDGADKQLKASRLFLEQQAVEREQEREEASEQQKKLQGALAEKEKELERIKTSADQLATDLHQMQELAKEKDKAFRDQAAAQQHLEQQLKMLQLSQSDLAEENASLQTVLDVKDKLLKAQAEQIAALQNELENQLYGVQSESERDVAEARRDREEMDRSSSTLLPNRSRAEDVPSLFDELQQIIVRLLHKVDNSTRALEAAQWTKEHKTHNNNTLLSPRGLTTTPSTFSSTEDISVRDRNPAEGSQTPMNQGQSDPELAISFLQQLDGKLAVLSRIEEATCKRVVDLEAEVARVAGSEKESRLKAAELERKAEEVEAEKQELLMEHTELLRRISSLENRLEEQRRSAVLGASQNPHAEKCRSLSEEKQQLLLIVQEKEESVARMQEEMSELHQRIDKLMKAADFSQSSSIERLRDAPGHHQQDGSMTWSRMQVNQSPVPVSPIQKSQKHPPTPQPVEIPLRPVNDAEIDELRAQLHKSEEQRRNLEDELTSRTDHLNSLLEGAERDKQEAEERCETLQKELEELRIELKRFEKEAEELKSARRTAEKELADQLLAGRTLADELRKRCEGLEVARNSVLQEYDIVRRRCLALETESAAQRDKVSSIELLQQRCATLQADLIHQQEVAERQSADLKACLLEKERSVSELQAKLKASDGCKAQVEQALRQLQLEVEAIKQAQQMRPSVPKDLSALIEGPAAPPDLLAPSFVEFLGSASSSRASSRPSSVLKDSITLTDLSLPSSMAGKTVLKELQKESEELLTIGKQLLELQQQRKMVPSQDPEDPETTLQPDGVSFEACNPKEAELAKKVQLLEMQLAMERLLLQDQRATNARQQQQMMQLIAKQRSNSSQQEPQLPGPRGHSSLRSLKPGQANMFMQYRALKLESIRKNLIYQKKFLVGIVQELDHNQNERLLAVGKTTGGWAASKPSRRFRILALAVISIGRMRYVAQQWRQRRRAIESQSLSSSSHSNG